MKPKQSFEDIQARIQDHYQSGEYASALALASEHAPRSSRPGATVHLLANLYDCPPGTS